MLSSQVDLADAPGDDEKDELAQVERKNLQTQRHICNENGQDLKCVVV
jgi:hypothetical protein